MHKQLVFLVHMHHSRAFKRRYGIFPFLLRALWQTKECVDSENLALLANSVTG